MPDNAPLSVLVTGANRGIGLALARLATERGDRVIATARRPGDAEELRELCEDGLRLEPLDVTREESIAGLAECLDGEPLDVLVNNAGVGGARTREAVGDLESHRACLEVNAFGPLRLTLALRPNLAAGRSPRVIQITSQLGSMQLNEGGSYEPYRVSKAALNMISRSLAAKLADDGVTVLLVHPGWVRTDMGGKRAPVSPEESARGILERIDRATRRDSGRFVDWLGRPMPW